MGWPGEKTAVKRPLSRPFSDCLAARLALPWLHWPSFLIWGAAFRPVSHSLAVSYRRNGCAAFLLDTAAERIHEVHDSLRARSGRVPTSWNAGLLLLEHIDD